jgi:hypothetical protein
MIAASDLRIGNWVMYHGETDTPCQIDSTDIKNIDEKYMNNHEIHSPIPLTPVNLLRLGFVFNKMFYWVSWSGGVFVVKFNKGTNKYFIEAGNSDIWIENVHSLQNVFYSFTGQELKLIGCELPN